MDYKYNFVDLVLKPFAWDMLHFYEIMGILKAQNDYVRNNEDPQRPRLKKENIDKNVVVTTID